MLGVAGSLARARQAVSEFDRIGKAAAAGGLSAETYQIYAHGADLAGIAQNKFNKLLQTFFKNANDAAIGTGALKTGLDKINPALLQSIVNARSQEERMRLLASAVQNSTSEIERAAIAQAAFGAKGSAMVNFLLAGADGFDRLEREAREMGIVIENDVVRNAENMNDKLTIASRIIDANLNKAFVDLAPVIVAAAEATAGLVGEIARLVDGFREVEKRSSSALNDNLAQSGMKRIEIENKILELQHEQHDAEGRFAGVINQAKDKRIAQLRGELSELEKHEKRVLDTLQSRDNQNRIDGAFETRQRSFIAERAAVNTPSKSSRSSGGRSASSRAATVQRDAVMDVVNALKFEASQLGLTNTEQRINNELKRAGVEASSSAGQAIAQLVTDIEAEKQAIEASARASDEKRQKLQEITDLQVQAAQGAINVGAAFVRGSAEGKQALIQLGFQILEIIAKAQALNGNGFLGSVLGLFGIGGGSPGGFFGGLPGFA